MGIKCEDLRMCVIRPVLQDLGLFSPSAENLLLGTAAQESHMGTYLKQVRGPALGIFQMEPATHNDIWGNFLKYNDDLARRVFRITGSETCGAEEMVGNLFYAAAMARILYLRVPEPLPGANDLPSLARYYKKHYNTHLGKATEQDFIENYHRYVENG